MHFISQYPVNCYIGKCMMNKEDFDETTVTQIYNNTYASIKSSKS
jgi:hypothetical protein